MLARFRNFKWTSKQGKDNQVQPLVDRNLSDDENRTSAGQTFSPGSRPHSIEHDPLGTPIRSPRSSYLALSRSMTVVGGALDPWERPPSTPTKTPTNALMTSKSQINQRPPAWWDVSSDQFHMISGVATTGYAILVGLETDYGVDNFMVYEYVFAVLFSIEVFMRMYQTRAAYWRDAWNYWDILLLGGMVVDLYILPTFFLGVESNWLDALRVLRLVKALRIIRIFRVFHDLVNIFNAFKEALSVVLWLSMLILILDYICAIFLTETVGKRAHLWGDSEEAIKGWFGTIKDSMQTLFMVQTLSDWNEVAETVMQVVPRLPVMLFCVTYILLASYTMISLITGVVSESLIIAQQDDSLRRMREVEEDRERLCEELKGVLDEFDQDNSGNLTKHEVENALAEHPEFLTRLQALDIYVDLKDILDIVERWDATDGVPINRLADTLTALSGTAKASALMGLRNKVEDEISELNQELSEMKGLMRGIIKKLDLKVPQSPKA